MADFCLECFNKIHGTSYTHLDVLEEWGLCEECGEEKEVIMAIRGYSLFDNIIWFFHHVSYRLRVIMEPIDDYLWRAKLNHRFRYTKEQKQAMANKIPMTEELFWGCMNVCYCRHDRTQLRWLMKTYPQWMRKFHEDYERELRENPERQAEEEREWQRIRGLLVEDYGEEYVSEHFDRQLILKQRQLLSWWLPLLLLLDIKQKRHTLITKACLFNGAGSGT